MAKRAVKMGNKAVVKRGGKVMPSTFATSKKAAAAKTKGQVKGVR